MLVDLETNGRRKYTILELTKGRTYRSVKTSSIVLATQNGIVCLATGSYWPCEIIVESARYEDFECKVVNA